MENETGLDGRHRDADGGISEKHGNTQIGTLREIYGDDFAPGRRADMHLETLLTESRVETLGQYLKQQKT